VQWFLLWEIIIKNIIMAQKDHDGTFTWVKLTSQYHSFLIYSGLQLLPHQLVILHPPKGLYKLVSQVISVFILEILLEGPWKGFFNLPKNPHKEEKKKWWQEAQKVKGKSVEKSISPPNIPLSPQHMQAPYLGAPSVSSSTKEELKILELKSQKGMLTGVEKRQLAILRGAGSNTGTVDPGHRPRKSGWGLGH
jgi:hypothetical protein